MATFICWKFLSPFVLAGTFYARYFFIYTLRAWVLVCKSVFFSLSPRYLVPLFFLTLSFVMDLGRIGVSAGGVDIFSFSVYSVGLDGQ